MRAAATLPEVVGYLGALDGIDLAADSRCVGAGGDLCVDGAIGSRTAAMHTPYVDADTSGHLYLTSEQVRRRHVVACTNAGL